MKKRLVLFGAALLVGVVVALTYYVFEAIVRLSIEFVWDDVFATNTHRLVIVPLCLALSLIYFGAQHYLDPKGEKHETHGLGAMPTPTLKNFAVVLFVGFLSLLAGASLGPEAILVPACMLVGGYVGVRLFKKDKYSIEALSTTGFVALFTAFFNSLPIGILSILLVQKQLKRPITTPMLIACLLAALSSSVTLKLIEGRSLFHFPPLEWNTPVIGLLGIVIVFALGFGATYVLRGLHDGFNKLYVPYLQNKPWWLHAIIASAGLSSFYLIAGPLIQFTGNESIKPLVDQAAGMSIGGLALIIIAKLAAIAWSKALGYRGGLIFPSVFVVTGISLLVGTIIDFNIVHGIIAGIAGMLVADKWVKILT